MTIISNSPQIAPLYGKHREAIGAVDVIANVKKSHGINMSDYRFANIQIVPEGGANPNIEVLFWCEKTSQFIPSNTGIVKTGLGINKPYEFSIDSNGRIIFVAITVITAGTVDVYVSGYGLNHTL